MTYQYPVTSARVKTTGLCHSSECLKRPGSHNLENLNDKSAEILPVDCLKWYKRGKQRVS